jgi:PAS domain S-box-containing protein
MTGNKDDVVPGLGSGASAGTPGGGSGDSFGTTGEASGSSSRHRVPNSVSSQIAFSSVGWVGLVAGILAVLLMIASGVLASWNLSRATAADTLTETVRNSLIASEAVLSTLKDAETGQRGYLLTGDLAYLEPYHAAQRRLNTDFAWLETSLSSPAGRAEIATIRSLAAAKMTELSDTIALAESGYRDAALTIVTSNRGQHIMESIRASVDRWQAETQTELARLQKEARSLWIWGGAVGAAALALFCMGGVAFLQSRARQSLAATLVALDRFTSALKLSHGMLRTPDGRITFWSDGMKQLYGYDALEAVGHISHDLLSAKFPEPLADIERTLRDTGHWQGELVHQRQDGSAIVVASHWALNDRGDGAPVVIEVSNDITLLKQTETALRDSELSLRLALDASGVGCWRFEKLNGHGEKIIWDERYRALVGFRGAERADYATWLSIVHPDDRADARKQLDRALDPNDPHDAYALDYRAVHRGGRIVHISSLGHAVFESDPDAPASRRPRAVIGTAHDVTKTRTAEQQERQRAAVLLQTIVDTAPGLIYAKGTDGRLLVANQQLLKLIGKPWDVVKGRTDLELLDDAAEAEAVMANDRRIMNSGASEEVEEYIGKSGDAARIWLATKTPMRDLNNNVIGLVGVSIEITERKHGEERLLTLVDELNHRVKNTLTTVQAIASQTLRRAEPNLRDSLQARLFALASAHDVLTKERWRGANLDDVITFALNPYCDREEGRVVVSGPDVRLNPRAALGLSMVLHELLTNALKYGALAAAAGRVTLRWEIQQEPTSEFRLVWSESGVDAAAKSQGPGFGTRLIEHVVEQDLAGRSVLDLTAGGFVWTINAPLTEIVPTATVVNFPALPRRGAA